MSDLVIVSKLADLTGVPYYGDLKLGSATMSPLTESTSCVLTGFDETIQAHSYDPIRCCNAAVYKCISRQEFYIFCPLSEPKYLLVYKTGSIFSQSRYQNVQYGEIYLDTLNYGNISFDGASFPYFNFSLDYRNVGGDNKVTWIEDLPVFENLKDFVNYVTKPRPSVKVNYYIPEGTYQYCKLTYKKDKEPESVNDGTIVNIDPTETDIIINGLDEKSKYYFTIYTDKSESNPFLYEFENYNVPDNAVVWILAEAGMRDLVGHKFEPTRASVVSCNGEYFYIDENAEYSGGFYAEINRKFTGNLDLWFETECYIGDSDLGSGVRSNSEYHFTLNGSNLSEQYENRIWQITYRNAMFDHTPSALEYDYWYNSKIRNILSIMDNVNYCNKWTKIKIKTEVRNSRITKLISYRDEQVFREDNESNYDISNVTFKYFSCDLNTKSSQYPVYNVFRAKYFKFWVDEVVGE